MTRVLSKTHKNMMDIQAIRRASDSSCQSHCDTSQACHASSSDEQSQFQMLDVVMQACSKPELPKVRLTLAPHTMTASLLSS